MIPKEIILVWVQGIELIPDYIIKKWHNLNPEFNIKLFDNDIIIKFLEDNYTEEFVNFYNKIKFYKYKSDFFRYCYLYINGGYYIDIDTEPIIPIKNLELEKKTFVSMLSLYFKGHIAQGILFTNAKNPIIKKCLSDMLYYGYNIGIDPPDKYPYFGHPTKCMYDNISKLTNKSILYDEMIESNDEIILLGKEINFNGRETILINNKIFGFSRYLNYVQNQGFIENYIKLI